MNNSFTLSSGGRSGTRLTESRNHSSQRRFNSNPMVIDYDGPDCISSEDKENYIESSIHNECNDLSLYGGASPQSSPLRACQLSPCVQKCRSNLFNQSRKRILHKPLRQPLEDHDPNSTDSDAGYGASFTEQGPKSFQFAAPSTVVPRRLIEPSPNKMQSPTSKSSCSLKIFHSLSSGSMESMDDGFIELFDMDSMDENAQLPCDLNSLISGDIKSVKTPDRATKPSFCRSLSLTNEVSTPELFSSLKLKSPGSTPTGDNSRCFKRPEPPCDLMSPTLPKRRKSTSLGSIVESPEPQSKQRFLQRSLSDHEHIIKQALARSSMEPDLIGDFSKPFCLPLMEGRHQDLKSISTDTLAALIRGEFNDTVASFKVIDCRYPYEFDGGHIRGAKNLYTKDQIVKELVETKTGAPKVQYDGPSRHILVFHCEFSSERGPKLSRFLRNFDRDSNREVYPALHYPEIYLLHGGYKEFFAAYSDLCDPIAYRPMLDPEFDADLKVFRAKSKSWNGDSKSRFTRSRSRLNL